MQKKPLHWVATDWNDPKSRLQRWQLIWDDDDTDNRQLARADTDNRQLTHRQVPAPTTDTPTRTEPTILYYEPTTDTDNLHRQPMITDNDIEQLTEFVGVVINGFFRGCVLLVVVGVKILGILIKAIISILAAMAATQEEHDVGAYHCGRTTNEQPTIAKKDRPKATTSVTVNVQNNNGNIAIGIQNQ